MSKSIETARADMAIIVPHLREAAEDAMRRAKNGARVCFAIVAKNPDGSGQIGACFECEEFLSDLETIFPPTEDDKSEAHARCLVSKLSSL